MIDFSHFFNELDNDPESIELIFMAYLEEYSDSETKFQTLFNSSQWVEIHMLSHSLKGILNGFGEKHITDVLEEIEQQTHTGQAANKGLISQVCIALPDIRSQINAELSRLAV